MFWEFMQQYQINEANAKASEAQSRAGNADQRMRRLEIRLESMALACQALWEITSERAGLTARGTAGKNGRN